MASIRKNKAGGYEITVKNGRDINGRQIRSFTTWTPEPGMTERQIDKALKKFADQYEEKVKNGGFADMTITFAAFAEKWAKEYARLELKAKTVAEYEKRLPRINQAIGHKKLCELKTGHINSFYSNLREPGMNALSHKAAARPLLKEVIKSRKLTMLKVSEDAGLSASTVYVACRGTMIDRNSAEKIAKALGMKFNECFAAKDGDGCLTASTVRTYHRLLSSILSKAVKWGYMQNNPAVNAELPKLKQHEAEYLDEDEAKRLLDLLQEEPVKYRTAITFDLLNGLRRGELLGLRWRDVDFENETVQVRETRAYVSGKGVITDTPKNASSKRPLRLSRSVFVLLRNYQAWQESQKDLCGSKWRNADDRVFTNEDGSPLYPDTLSKWFRDFAVTNGFQMKKIHGLRHSFASLMISAGTPLVVVSKRLGHNQVSTTSNIYSHMIRSAEEKALEATDIFDEQITRLKAAK